MNTENLQKTKKCPSCKQEISLNTTKCPYCGKPTGKNKGKDGSLASIVKWLIIIAMALAVWPITIPACTIWYLFKKTDLEKKYKWSLSIITILIIIGSLMFIWHKNRSPILVISEPVNGVSVQASLITIKGTVTPKYSKISSSIGSVARDEDHFTITVPLTDEVNKINIIASNASNTEKRTFIVNRIFTKEELAIKAKIKADQEAKEKAEKEQIEADKRAWKASPAGKICTNHPEWTETDCVGLANNKIWIGMTYDMLVYLLGYPDSTNPSNYGSGTQYQYCWHDNSPSCFYDNNDDGIIDSYN